MTARHKSDRPGYDIVANAAASTGTFATGPCKAIRCVTAGTFIGLTLQGQGRTVTLFNPGEILPVGFQSRTGGTADVDLIY